MKFADKVKLLTTETAQTWQRLREQAAIQHPNKPVMELFDEVHNSAPVFVLSTGRAGTQFLTTLLAHSEKVKAHHEPNPTLNQYNRLAWEGNTALEFLKGVFEGARYELIRDAYILDKQYVETNNRLTFLAPVIAALYPKARFVHLVRKPEAFVKSGMQRGWYQNTNIHDEGRIVKQEGWAEMDEVERIAWLWAETNRWIHEFFKTLPQDQKLFIPSERLYRDADLVAQLAGFFGASDVTRQTIEKLQKRPVNKSAKITSQLTEADKTKIKNICDPIEELLNVRKT